MLTVACVWAKSPLYDSKEWVRKLFYMVSRNLTLPFRFVCLTNEETSIGACTTGATRENFFQLPFSIHPPSGWFLWWYKLNLFSLKGERILYLDLDTVVLGRLDDLVDYPSDFVMAPTSGIPTKNHDFNSSVMVWTPGAEQHRIILKSLLPDWKQFPGDQQWLSSLKMRIDAFPYRWIHKYLPGKGPYLPPEDTRVALMIQGGKNKALLDDGHAWIGEYWK